MVQVRSGQEVDWSRYDGLEYRLMLLRKQEETERVEVCCTVYAGLGEVVSVEVCLRAGF